MANRVSGTGAEAATEGKEGRPTGSASNDEARSTEEENEAAGDTRQRSPKKKKGAFDFDDEEDVENGTRTPDQSMDDDVGIEAQGEPEQEDGEADNDVDDAGVDAEDTADEAPPLPPLAYFADYGNRVCFLNLAEWIICYQDTFLEGQGAADTLMWRLRSE